MSAGTGPGVDADRGRFLWFDPGFGASGDMVLGTLLGLGAPVERIRRQLRTLAIDGWTLNHETTRRCSLSADRAVVTSTEQQHHRSWTAIDSLLAEADLPEPAKVGSRATFRRLGEVEAAIHDVDIDEVHFHEVGAVDAIVDIVGSWLALDALSVDRVSSGPVGLGDGSTEAAHGRLPIPAPATARLLIGAEVRPVDVAAETVTPTGAALLATMATSWAAIPIGTLLAVSRGAGGRDPAHYPNVLTGYLLDCATSANPSTRDRSGAEVPVDRHQAMVLTTNLDDVTPEIVGHTIARCLEAGADDAWATPIVMKKGRPAVQLSVLAAADRLDHLQDVIFAETGSLGMRTHSVTKHVLRRRFQSVTIRGQTIDIKVGPYGAKPEHDDLVRAAETLKIPVRKLANEAVEAFRAADDDV